MIVPSHIKLNSNVFSAYMCSRASAVLKILSNSRKANNNDPNDEHPAHYHLAHGSR